MAKGQPSAGSGLLEYGAVVLFKVAPLVAGILLALQIYPDNPIQIVRFISIEAQFFIYIISIVAILSTIEAKAINKSEGGGIAGASFAFWVAMIIALAGYAFAIYIAITNYSFNDVTLNSWIAYYLFLGAILIFINSREQIFFHKAILRALRAT